MIPARYGASRFPGKLMQDLGGKPVIVRTYEAAKATELFDEVYVVTDSEVIFKEIEMNGGKAIMSQKEHDCGSDRIAEAVENMDVDIVVNVQGDEPFTSREGLEKVLAVFNEPDADKIDLASLMTEIHDWKEISDPNCVKVIVDKDNFALYFSRSPIPYPRDKNVDIQYYKHKGIYAFRKQAIMDFYRLPMRSLEAVEKIECIRYLEYGKNIKMAVSNTVGVEIDTPEDLVKANKILKENKPDSVNNKFRNFPMVPKVIFGEGCFDQLLSILSAQKQEKAPFIFLVDDVFKENSEFLDRINLRFNDKLIFVSAEEEPKTSQKGLFDDPNETDYVRREAISDFILERAKKQYGKNVTKEDIFYYVYGFLHSQDYRETFASDLKKMLPKLPLVEEVKDFWAFSKAGRQLADLHLNYETVPAYPEVNVVGAESTNFLVDKMRFPKKGQKDTIIYNSHIVISNIPEKAYEYIVNGKSAIEWIMERYQMEWLQKGTHEKHLSVYEYEKKMRKAEVEELEQEISSQKDIIAD